MFLIKEDILSMAFSSLEAARLLSHVAFSVFRRVCPVLKVKVLWRQRLCSSLKMYGYHLWASLLLSKVQNHIQDFQAPLALSYFPGSWSSLPLTLDITTAALYANQQYWTGGKTLPILGAALLRTF